MSSDKELLNRILSGDFSPDELAGNPILVSLAERVYGIKIDPVKMTKPRDFVEPELATEITEVAPPTDMLIEVIGNIAPGLGTIAKVLGIIPNLRNIYKNNE